MGQYRKRPVVVEANQYLKRGECPLGVKTREDGTAYVTTIQKQDVVIKPGEWAIREPDGVHFYPCADEVFKATYELAP